MSSGGDERFLASTQAYLKMMMHCLKYPEATVNGLILVKRRTESSQDQESKPQGSKLEIVDVVPLFHLGHGLSPMIEVALLQVHFVCGLHVLTFYRSRLTVRTRTCRSAATIRLTNTSTTRFLTSSHKKLPINYGKGTKTPSL